MKFAFYSFFLTLPLFAGCSQAEDKNQVAVAVRSINYNADRGVTFSLYDVSGQPDPKYKTDPHIELRLDGYYPVGGGNLMALDGGGSECCANLPKQWRPGLKYTVLWQAGSADLPDKTVYRHTAELPRYEQPEDLTVVFYPQHEVEFVVGSSYPGEAGWKGRERKEPLEACMDKNDKRFCYMYLPHYEREVDRQAESWRIECREKITLNKAQINTEETKQEYLLFLQNQIKQAKEDNNFTWLKEMEFEVIRSNRPNRIGKTFCELWSMDCKENYDRIDSYSSVSNKNMCNINWRSEEWGE